MSKPYGLTDTVKISQGEVQLLMKESIFSPLRKNKFKISYLYTVTETYPLKLID